MVLAAGLGTRLRPLTDDRPKALVQVGGRPLLDIALARLREFGVRDVIVNVHHFADMVVDYLKANQDFGMRVEVSREDDLLLDTGGGLKKAGWFFLRDNDSLDRPFILHNVDVISTIDLGLMLAFHQEHKPLATVAVQQRESSRCLLFDEEFALCGRRVAGRVDELTGSRSAVNVRSFSGIHVISPRLLHKIREEGAFSIIDAYLRLAGSGEKILAFPADQFYWRDVGRLEDLSQAAEDLREKRLV
ncbi:MAG: nucleotidyltransferase family protein [Actinomycetota bacterium]